VSDEPPDSHDQPDSSVLICDDNVAMRVLLGVIIDTAAGLHVVGEAADGDEAVLEATRLQPDVILLDLAMPNRSGLEALPDLRRVAPDAQIVVLSGFAEAAVAEEVLALGARNYLQKGADPDTIVAAIQDATEATPSRACTNAGLAASAGSLTAAPVQRVRKPERYSLLSRRAGAEDRC
jgi:DNA-binding NarL/FixJ family response regulator